MVNARGEIEHNRVETGPLVSDGLRVVTKGLNANDQVVVSRLRKIRPGESLTLESGDLMILFTDGVLEAAAPDDTLFGESRVLEVVRGSQSEPASHIISRLHRAVLDFRRKEVLLDDMTAIVLKVDVSP